MMRFQKRIGVWSVLFVLLLAGTSSAQRAPDRTRNAALQYWVAFALMQDPPADKATLDLMEAVVAGKASWDERRLGPIIDINFQALHRMNLGVITGDCDWGMYDLSPTAPVPHLAKARVLGRLNLLGGIRLAADGHLPLAISQWLRGVRFAQHVAQGGSLISLLSARLIFDEHLSALMAATRGVTAGFTPRARINAALNALPEGAFDWGAALQRETATAVWVVQFLSRVGDEHLKRVYQNVMGEAAPENFALPNAADLAAFREVMVAADTALRLSPEAARQSISDVEASRKELHPFLNRFIPSLSRINDTRIALETARLQALNTFAAPSR